MNLVDDMIFIGLQYELITIAPDRLVRRTILALTNGGTDYPKGSLFMDVENSTLEDLVRLAQDRYSWNLIVGNL